MDVSVAPGQLSAMVGGAQIGTAWHDALALTVILDGQFVSTGAMLSLTVTLNEQVALFPAASVAVYVTIVVPVVKLDPGE